MFIRLAVLLQVTSAFVRPNNNPARVPASSSALQASATDAIGYLNLCQSASVTSIVNVIPDLVSKPDFTWDSSSGMSVGGSPVTLDARDAAGPSNIAWLSSLTVDSKLCSLTIFNGPLTDVPHLISRCIVVNNNNAPMMQFTLDFRPRTYGAYELRRLDGSYPGPEELGRKSFEYSGARTAFDTKFGTADVQHWLASTIASLEGASLLDSDQPTPLDLLTRGPLYTSIIMPLTDGNVQTIARARGQAVNYWLEWVQDGGNVHRPGAPVNTQYVYDTKFKQNCYGALLNEYQSLFGSDDGTKLAVGDSGPLDEAYVGGGS
jgi:hypothetical protein